MSALRRSTLLRSLLIAVVAALVLFGISELVGEYRNSQLASVALNFCAIAGLTVLIGRSGQVSLGHGAFLFVGGYTVALMLKHHTFPNSPTTNKLFILALLVAVAVSAAVGALAGLAAARLRGPYLAGVTLALALGLPELPTYSHLSGWLGGHTGLVVNIPNSLDNVDFARWQAWICCACAVITLFLLYNLIHSRVGRAFEAVRDDEVAASLAGLSVARVQVLAFVVSAAAAGLAGGLYALTAGQVDPLSFPLTLSLDLLAASVIGGLGTLSGAAYGAVLITFLPSWAQDVSGLSATSKVGANLPTTIFGLALVVSMLLLPNGIQGLLSSITRRLRNGAAPMHRTAFGISSRAGNLHDREDT
ncbi:MAG TPA: branched-chain amino acid ABC transporter permease [Mycobacteriales bacterium]|nr:branched-chain amino acid ABC transporter permease [Mycobacteriales bacterium]